MVSIHRTGAVADILYLRASMLKYFYTAHLSPALSVVPFNSCTPNATEHVKLS